MRHSAPAPAAPELGSVRRPVAVLVSRFPLLTETFILREIDELERQGQPVVLVPLLRERPEVVHPEARPWIARALYTPYLSPAIARANLHVLASRPRSYLRTLLQLVRETALSPSMLVRSLVLFPKAVALAEALSERGVHHLHAHFATHPATVAWTASRLSSLTFSFTAHAHDLFVDETFLAEKVRAARFVRTISEFNRSWLLERWPEAREKIAVVPMGIPTERYRRRAGSEPSHDDEPAEILCIAALKPYKGIPILLRACELLCAREIRFRCRVIGEGPARAELEEEIGRRRLGDRVELLGAQTQEEVARRLLRARLVVLSSIVAEDGQMEGLPVALMEAAAAGRPIVAPDLSGIPELVEDGETGLLFPVGDAGALADRMERLLRSPELGRALGRRARERVEERFRLGITAEGLLRLLDRENPAPSPELRALARALVDSELPLGVERVYDSPDARVLRLLVASPSGARRLILKQHRSRPGESAPPDERAAREADVLRRLASLRDAGIPLGAPGILRQDEESAALLLEPVPGTPLDVLLRRWRLAPGAASDIEAAGRRCGAWLRHFQANLEPPDLPHPARSWAKRLERAIRRSTATDRRQANGLVEMVTGALSSGEVVARHGDLWPGNLRLSDDQVSVLDFEGFGPGGAWEDAARLLVHAELYFPPVSGRRFARFEAGFLSGFERAGDPQLAVFRAAEALLGLEAEIWRNGTRLLAPWRRRLLRRRLREGAR